MEIFGLCSNSARRGKGEQVLAARYKVAGQDIVSETFDDDVVVLDLNSGRYFSFTDAGCRLWQALAEGASPRSLVFPQAVYSEEELEAFLGRLVDHGLLVADQAEADAAASGEAMDRLSAAREKPDIFVFDDLADLFLADPIHDVEEPVGWPAVKKG